MQAHCCGDDVTGSPASSRTVGVAALRRSECRCLRMSLDALAEPPSASSIV